MRRIYLSTSEIVMCILSFQLSTNVSFSAIKIQNRTKIHRNAQLGHDSYLLCGLLNYQVWSYYYYSYYFPEIRVRVVCFRKKSCPLPRSDLPKIVSFRMLHKRAYLVVCRPFCTILVHCESHVFIVHLFASCSSKAPFVVNCCFTSISTKL